MKNEKKTFVDGNGKEITISSSDFKLVQTDSKIHDVKFNKKPTTFFKDAMRRFASSKSAVIGGVIVGLLALGAIVIPLFTSDSGVYDVSSMGGGKTIEADLPPKLFSAGTGFWDGTVKREGVIFDTKTNKPVSYTDGTYFNLVTYESTLETYSEYGTGGVVNCTSSTTEDAIYFSKNIDLDLTSSITLSYNLSDEYYSSYDMEGYKVAVYDGATRYYLAGSESSYITDFSKILDVTSLLKDKVEDDVLKNTRFEFIIKQSSDSQNNSCILISSINLTTSSSDEDFKTKLEAKNFSTGNEVMLRTSEDQGYWGITGGNRSAHNVKFTLCDFTFDKYANAYGIKEVTYSDRELITFINSGYIKVNLSSSNCKATSDKEELAKRFEITGDNSPFVEIVEQIGDAKYSSNKWNGYSLKVKVYNYRILGYEKMPSFIFGTNDYAKDYCKLMFTGMRFSLLLAVGVSAVNIVIGLIWGSISGYFGGWTDIIMERICDIISGLPSTVIITLCILYGREFNWGSSADVIALMVALFMTGWMGVSARTRTQFYRYKGREYVLASRTLGAKDGRLIFKHILPNASGTIITGSILMIPSVIYTEASIAYLGLGLQGQVLFGVILSEANSYYKGEKAFLLLIPTLIMVLLLISFNLFGNGLRDAFNPSLKGGKN